MKTSSVSRWLLPALLVLTLGVAGLHLTSREQIPEKTLLVECEELHNEVNFSSLPLSEVRGTLINGKGEHREIVASGCLLSQVLEAAGVSMPVEQIKVIASDEFSAEVTVEELMQPDLAYLIEQDDGRLQLVVFEDKDSKRNVKDVERLWVK